MSEILRGAWWILKKDLMVELRTRETTASMGLLALLMVVVFAFAFHVDQGNSRHVAPGIIWVVVLFSATVGLSRVFHREHDQGSMTVLLRAPAGPVAVYLGKAMAVFLFTLVMEAICVPLMIVFLDVDLPPDGVALLVTAMVLGTLGFVLVGTLFGAMLAGVRLRDVLLPVVVYPVVVPVIIAGVELTGIALGGGLPGEDVAWLRLMVGCDLLFCVISPWVFARVMVD